MLVLFHDPVLVDHGINIYSPTNNILLLSSNVSDDCVLQYHCSFSTLSSISEKESLNRDFWKLDFSVIRCKAEKSSTHLGTKERANLDSLEYGVLLKLL